MDSFDPRIFNENDSYRFFLDGTTKPTRGKFEYAFSRIGLSFLTGGAVGWAIGSYNGAKFLQTEMSSKGSLTGNLAGLSWKVKRSHMLNYIVKTGANTANTFALIAFTYSTLNTALSYAIDNDDLNTLTAATSTGILYRYISTPKPKPDATGQLVKQVLSTKARLSRAGMGGLVGLGVGISMIYLINDIRLFKTPHAEMFGRH